MVATLCRNGLHPISERRARPSEGRSVCEPCAIENHQWHRANAPYEDALDPAYLAAKAERQAAYTAWAAGVDDAITRLRREHGFDGRRRAWKTLGDVVGMQATPPPPRPDPRLRIVNCGRCGTPRFASARCATCALASARFQTLAAPDAGARFGPTGRELIRGH